MTRILRRVIVRLVTPISLVAIADITARYFMRGICAILQRILAYRYTANNDAQFSARYIAYGDAAFAVRHIHFKLELSWRVLRRIRPGVLTLCYNGFSRCDF